MFTHQQLNAIRQHRYGNRREGPNHHRSRSLAALINSAVRRVAQSGDIRTLGTPSVRKWKLT